MRKIKREIFGDEKWGEKQEKDENSAHFLKVTHVFFSSFHFHESVVFCPSLVVDTMTQLSSQNLT